MQKLQLYTLKYKNSIQLKTPKRMKKQARVVKITTVHIPNKGLASKVQTSISLSIPVSINSSQYYKDTTKTDPKTS